MDVTNRNLYKESDDDACCDSDGRLLVMLIFKESWVLKSPDS